jgi:hypothetical protein
MIRYHTRTDVCDLPLPARAVDATDELAVARDRQRSRARLRAAARPDSLKQLNSKLDSVLAKSDAWKDRDNDWDIRDKALRLARAPGCPLEKKLAHLDIACLRERRLLGL